MREIRAIGFLQFNIYYFSAARPGDLSLMAAEKTRCGWYQK